MSGTAHGVWIAASLVAALLSACGGDDTTQQQRPSRDLSVPYDDFAVMPLPLDGGQRPGSTDLGHAGLPNYDLAWSMCAGTSLAGTCAEAFFEPFVACFQPAGHCGTYFHNLSSDWCWQNGAMYQHFNSSGDEQFGVGGKTCLDRYRAGTQTRYCGEGASACTPADAGALAGGALYDSQSGVFTCPDGTQVLVGPNLGGCPVLNALLDPNSICDRAGSCF